MSDSSILILGEHPPPTDDRPAHGLAVRHARMAEAWRGAGVEVVHAWPSTGTGTAASGDGRRCALADARALATLLAERRPATVVLGFWSMADWLPESLRARLVLDYVAPRMLERQFEQRGRLADDARALLAVLARCDEVWVGNARQRDLLAGWMLMAGHDCRHDLPVRVVPIAGPVAETAPTPDVDEPLRVFHRGRDWPWRRSAAWLQSLGEGGDRWRLDAGAEADGLDGHAAYLQRLRTAGVALEVGDDNVERRFSQSYRMADALCAGVPVICNQFLPLADAVRRYEAGWTVATPGELPALVEAISRDRAERDRRAANALSLARDRLDARRVYAPLAEPLARPPAPSTPRKPLLGSDDGGAPGLRRAFADYAGRWFDHRVRGPLHRLARRVAADRPRPGANSGSTWIIVSRPDLFPTRHGAAVRIERTAWGLSHHVDEVLLVTDRRGGYWRYVDGDREQRSFPWWLRLVGWPRAVNLVRLMARGWPYSNAFLYLPVVDRGLNARLLWLLRRHPVEVVHGEFPAYALPAVWCKRLFGTRAVLVEHNVEFDRIAEQVPELSARGFERLRRLEVDVANACDRVVTVSERDRDRLVEQGVRPGAIVTVPHGVDRAAFERAEPVDLRARFGLPADHAVLVYHGIYSYPPNLEAVRELAEKVLPALAARGVAARVIAFGPEPPATSPDGVVFAGAVDDLAGHLKGGDVAVVPLRSGGGTRMKILDDFAAGVPVVTTAKGMQGLPVEDGRHLRIVEAPDEMADVVAALLADAGARQALAEAAAEWVARYDWREIARRTAESVRAAG